MVLQILKPQTKTISPQANDPDESTFPSSNMGWHTYLVLPHSQAFVTKAGQEGQGPG